ncbi:unnamed protein product, partial [Oppiella nova]
EESLAVERKVMDIKIRNKRLTEDEIVSQAFVLMSGGFSATSSLLAFTAYEFALNPDYQRRLRDEITDAISATNGEMPYDVLARLPYLDAVVSEILRRHFSPISLFRYPSVDYRLGDTGITLKAGQQIEIPTYAIHLSDEYYPDPFKFDPDRFMPENRHLIKPYTFLPFGGGPRNCVSMRFALLQIKTCLAHIVLKYQFFKTPKTDVPLQYQRSIKIIPFCRSVLMTARELNIELNVIEIDAGAGDQLKPQFLKLNPSHKIPTIVDEGFVLWESRAVMQYLCNKYGPDSTLYPRDPKKRAIVDRWLNYDTSLMESMKSGVAFCGVNPPEDKITALKTNLKLTDQLIGDKRYVTADHLTIADLTLLVTTVPLLMTQYDLP